MLVNAELRAHLFLYLNLISSSFPLALLLQFKIILLTLPIIYATQHPPWIHRLLAPILKGLIIHELPPQQFVNEFQILLYLLMRVLHHITYMRVTCSPQPTIRSVTHPQGARESLAQNLFKLLVIHFIPRRRWRQKMQIPLVDPVLPFLLAYNHNHLISVVLQELKETLTLKTLKREPLAQL